MPVEAINPVLEFDKVPDPKELIEQGLTGKRWLVNTPKGPINGSLNSRGGHIFQERVSFPKTEADGQAQSNRHHTLSEVVRRTYKAHLNGFFGYGSPVFVGDEDSSKALTSIRDFRVSTWLIDNKVVVEKITLDLTSPGAYTH